MNFGKSTVLGLASALAIGVGVAGTALAESEEHDGANKSERDAIGAASVSLTDAIRIAEQHINGTAEDAGVGNRDDARISWAIEVRGTDGKMQEILVDMTTGQASIAMLNNEGSAEREDGDEYEDH